MSWVAWYLSSEKNNKAQPADPVAKFHLGNGARLERVNWPSDFSDHGINNSFGAMVNYRYRIDEIEQNHEKFVEHGQINLSPETVKQVKAFSRFATLAPAKNPELVS